LPQARILGLGIFQEVYVYIFINTSLEKIWLVAFYKIHRFLPNFCAENCKKSAIFGKNWSEYWHTRL